MTNVEKEISGKNNFTLAEKVLPKQRDGNNQKCKTTQVRINKKKKKKIKNEKINRNLKNYRDDDDEK